MLKGIFVVVIISLLSGCFPNNAQNSEDSTVEVQQMNEYIVPTAQPKRGGILRVPIPEVSTLNPLLAKEKATLDFLSIIFEGLFEFDQEYKPVPLLVKSYEVEQNGLVWRITLHSDIRFHDGRLLTVDDVIFTFEALRGGALNSPFDKKIHLNPDLDTIVKSNDKDTFYVHLFEPLSNLKSLLTFPILPRHIYQSVDFIVENKQNFEIFPIGTGPFMADKSSWDAEDGLQLERNQFWRGREPLLDSIRGVFVNDKVQAKEWFIQNKVDVFDSENMMISEQVIGPNVNMQSYLTQNFTFLGINHDNSILSELMIREAVALSLNRQEMISVILNDRARYATSPLNPSAWFYQGNQRLIENGIDLISSRLDDAGFATFDENLVRVRETVSGVEKLVIRLLVNSENSIDRHTAKMIERQLSSVGFLVQTIVLPWNDFTVALSEKNYDMALISAKVGHFPDFDFTFMNYDNTPILFYESYRMSEILDSAKRAQSDEQFSSIVAIFQEYFYDMHPIISLFFRTSSVFLDSRIAGIENVFTGDVYRGIENWYLISNGD